jgi:hypothetical protein
MPALAYTRCSLAALLAFSALTVAPIAAQISAVPNSLNFQARLATPSSNPVPDGTYSVRFRFYDAATAGNVLYEKTVATVQVKNGTFAVLLDAIGATAFNGNAWVGIQIGTDAELSPRTQLVSVPYAIKSDLALTVPDGSLTAAKFASGVLNANAWLLNGNSGVTSGFLGTTDNQPLEFRVNGRRVMRYQYMESGSYRSMNVLGGSEINTIGVGVAGATIAGGGADFLTGTDSPNRIFGNFGTIGGGIFNTASGVVSTVGGGNGNTASGICATVPGGETNTAAGDYSFAAGVNAVANHDGTFVWADDSSSDFVSTDRRQFLIRATGGVGINTAIPGGALLRVKNASNVVGICAGDLAPVGAASFESNRVTNTSTYHLVLCNNGTDVFYVNGSGRPFGTGAYAQISDARYKRNIVPIENALDTILNLRGVTYEWDTEKWKERGLPEGKQIGFIAQEVEKILPELVSTDKNGYKSVSYADAVPVLVEAVKTLKKDNDNTKRENAELKAKNDKLEARLDAIERALAELKANK